MGQTSRREFFTRYPYWAVRLHNLYVEIEDPTPISSVGRWSELHKAARHMLWLTAVAFVVAILFGIVAAGLGAVQIWISYCDWQGEDVSRMCRKKVPDKPTDAQIVNRTEVLTAKMMVLFIA
jgi:hypothetical protein